MNLIRVYIIYFLILIPTFTFADKDNECKETKNKKAIKLFEQASYSTEREAISLLKEALVIEPEYVEAHFVLANIYLSKADKAVEQPSEFQKIDRYYKYSEEHFLKIVEFCPAFENYIAYYNLGDFYFYSRQYRKAKENFNQFILNNKTDKEKIKIVENKIDKLDRYFAIITNPVPFNPTSVKGVSSEKGEFLPLISPDGQYAFYTRRYEKKELNSIAANTVDEFTYSELLDLPGTEIEIYTDGQKMASPFNDGRDQGGVSITIDNRHMYLTICQMAKGNYGAYTNCDIYSSDFIDGQWTKPYNLGPNINKSTTWEGQPSISSDGKILYFASTREENVGVNDANMTSDIYFSKQDANGNWTKAQNIGTTINTADNEKSPFIHSDSQTLYFSSDGHLGLGKFDIFYTRMDKSNKWEEPINIGFPINTEDDDLGFSVNLKGDKAYFSSNKLSGKGSWDIYSFDLYENARPEEVVIVKGQLITENGEPIEDAEIVVKSTKSATVTKGMVDKKTGEYAIALKITDRNIPPPVKENNSNLVLTDNNLSNDIIDDNKTSEPIDIFDILDKIDSTNINTEDKEKMQKEILASYEHEKIVKAEKLNSRIENPYVIKKEPKKITEDDVVITVKKKGFAFTSSYIKPKELVQLQRPVLTENFEMKPIEVGKIFKLNNIQFPTNSARLTSESISILDDFSDFLIENPTIKIAIYGHTDNIGDETENLILSEDRAKSVYSYLLISDISSDRMSFEGFGENKPISDNTTEQGRALNRRTEFLIVEK